MQSPSTPATIHEALYFGLKLYELLTLIGVIIGPIVAVAITLLWQEISQKRERRMQVLRMLVATHKLPSDAAYNTAINLVKVEFNDQPKVMAAWSAYMTSVKVTPSKDGQEAHNQHLNLLQAKMMFSVMKCMGLKISETDILGETYMSNGFIARENLYLDSLLAMREIANSLKTQGDMLEGAVSHRLNDK